MPWAGRVVRPTESVGRTCDRNLYIGMVSQKVLRTQERELEQLDSVIKTVRAHVALEDLGVL